MNPESSHLTRRKFVGFGLAAVAAGTATSRAQSPNSKLNMGIIGSGGRGGAVARRGRHLWPEAGQERADGVVAGVFEPGAGERSDDAFGDANLSEGLGTIPQQLIERAQSIRAMMRG